eukprot:1277320-Ditylum_brightwellii.AAC.1
MSREMTLACFLLRPNFKNATVKFVAGMMRRAGKSPEASTGLWSFTSSWGCGIALDVRLSWMKLNSSVEIKSRMESANSTASLWILTTSVLGTCLAASARWLTTHLMYFWVLMTV